MHTEKKENYKVFQATFERGSLTLILYIDIFSGIYSEDEKSCKKILNFTQ